MPKSPKEYTKLLKGELLELAKRAGLSGVSSLTKDEIVARLTKAGKAIESKLSAATGGKTQATKASPTAGKPAAGAARGSATKSSSAKAAARPAAVEPPAKPAPAKPAPAKPAPAKPAPAKPAPAKPAPAKPAPAKPAPAKPVVATPAAARPAVRTAAAKVEAKTSLAKPAAAKVEAKTAVASRAKGPTSTRTSTETTATTTARPVTVAATTATGPAAAPAPERTTVPAATVAPAVGDLDAGLPDLPEGYADNRIVLLPRDPQWLYAYWDVTNEHKLAARRRGGQFLCLRLYDVTDIVFGGANAHAMWEQEVHELARNWYLHVPTPGRRYCLEIGYRGEGHQWLSLARSNTVPAPVDRPAERVHDEFVTIPFDRPLTALTGGGAGGPGRPAAAGGLHELLYQAAGGAGLATATSPGAWSGEVSGAWSGAAGAWSGATEAWSAAWSGVAGSVQPAPARDRGFWLRADAELIVHGRTEPDAVVLCGGRQVQLGPDGSFMLRFHFPDGVHDLPIEATAADREQRRAIRLTFQRRTG